MWTTVQRCAYHSLDRQQEVPQQQRCRQQHRGGSPQHALLFGSYRQKLPRRECQGGRGELTRGRSGVAVCASATAGQRVVCLRNFDWPQALLLDCDGVLVESEATCHREAFNQVFQQKNLQMNWSISKYGELVHKGGGAANLLEELRHTEGLVGSFNTKQLEQLCEEIVYAKREAYIEMVRAGELGLRSGVQRLINEALESDTRVAVCSNSDVESVRTIIETLLPKECDRISIFTTQLEGEGRILRKNL